MADEHAIIAALQGSPAPNVQDMSDPSSATPSKERHSLTLDQRRALRKWANGQQSRPSHKACIEWFQREYGQIISQSTVSHSLSPKYSRLDGDNPQLSGSRLRFGNWPDVERVVLLWYNKRLESGSHPTNEELAERAKSIFTQLPRYRGEQPPEFSPGWIHRFKKRYGLLVRRQRRHGDIENPAEDIDYLAELIPRYLDVSAETSPTAIREHAARAIGVEPSLSTCALVRDEIIRRQSTPAPMSGAAVAVAQEVAAAAAAANANGAEGMQIDSHLYGNDDDPEVVLQNALRQLQQEEAEAEASAAAIREERERAEQLGHHEAVVSTPTRHVAQRFSADDDLTLTPIDSGAPVSDKERPVRCPFCVNQRMLRTIKEAVEHLSSHVVV
jgi:hypothetical protein